VAPARIAWRLAAVKDVIVETPRAKTLVLDVPGWPGHVAGQHVDVRLTAEDGYQAQRSYSIASGRCDHARRTGAHALSRPGSSSRGLTGRGSLSASTSRSPRYLATDTDA
jgi:ferredoxin-NADP reductase